MIRRGLSTCAALFLVLALAACGGDDGSDGSDGSDGTTEVETIDISLADGAVTPDGDRVEVAVDQPVDLVVTSDVAGELHVHSSPEQYVEFDAGENEPVKLQFDRPGLVEIELHEPAEAPVVTLEVS